MASKRHVWNKAGRFFSGIVILCFFLPFFGVSCNGMEIISMSGSDMVFGCKPGGMIADMEDELAKDGPGGGGGALVGKIDEVERQPLAIAALAAAVIVFALGWVRSRSATFAAAVVAAAGLGAMVGLYVKVSGEMNEATALETGKGKPPPGGDAPTLDVDVEKELDVDVDAGARVGFWLTSLGFVGLAVLAGLAAREPDAPAVTAPPG